MEAETNHKYDTKDYTKIDPSFGDSETMRRLVSDAHAMGIRVMVDAVFNHCGRKFEPWQDVQEKGASSPYADWFMVNDWSQITKREDTRDGRFYSFAFADGMPKLNTNNPKSLTISAVCANSGSGNSTLTQSVSMWEMKCHTGF